MERPAGTATVGDGRKSMYYLQKVEMHGGHPRDSGEDQVSFSAPGYVSGGRFATTNSTHCEIFPLFPGRRAQCHEPSCSAAIKRRSRCGPLRAWPVLSWHFSPGAAPHVGQVTASICCGVSSFFMAEKAYCIPSGAVGALACVSRS